MDGPRRLSILFVIAATVLVAGSCLASAAQPARSSGDDWAVAVAKIAGRAVVTVLASTEGNDSGGSQGSGFLVSTGGLVVTNLHVIEGQSRALVKLDNGSFLPVTGAVRKSLELAPHDLVLLKCEGRDLPMLEFGDPHSLKVGDSVAAIGSPQGLEATFSTGVVSALRKSGPNLAAIQVTVPISHGSSGGPLLTREGKVVGITSAVVREGQNLNFAIPSAALSRLLKTLDEEARQDVVALEEVAGALSGKGIGKGGAKAPGAWDPPTDGFDVFYRLLALYDAAELATSENRLGLAGLGTIKVVAEDLPTEATNAGLTVGYLESYLELALNRGSILKTVTSVQPYLYANLNCVETSPGRLAYSLEMSVNRPAVLTLPNSIDTVGKPILTYAEVWKQGVIGECAGSQLRTTVTDTLDNWVVEFSNAVRKANPKREAPSAPRGNE